MKDYLTMNEVERIKRSYQISFITTLIIIGMIFLYASLVVMINKIPLERKIPINQMAIFIPTVIFFLIDQKRLRSGYPKFSSMSIFLIVFLLIGVFLIDKHSIVLSLPITIYFFLSLTLMNYKINILDRLSLSFVLGRLLNSSSDVLSDRTHLILYDNISQKIIHGLLPKNADSIKPIIGPLYSVPEMVLSNVYDLFVIKLDLIFDLILVLVLIICLSNIQSNSFLRRLFPYSKLIGQINMIIAISLYGYIAVAYPYELYVRMMAFTLAYFPILLFILIRTSESDLVK